MQSSLWPCLIYCDTIAAKGVYILLRTTTVDKFDLLNGRLMRVWMGGSANQ